MRRSLLHLLRAASLFLCIASLILWHRSYRVANGLAWQLSDGSQREIVSYAGGLHIRQIHPQYLLTPIAPARHKVADAVPANATWQTRAGSFANQVLWERAGFILLAGHTQTLTLTGNNIYNWSAGTINTSNVSNGAVTFTPITTSGGTINTPMLTSPTNPTLLSGYGGATLVLPADSTQLLLVIPWWFIVTLTALLPAATLAKAPLIIRHHRRRQRGLCTNCGYDLRSSTDRCPECGLTR